MLDVVTKLQHADENFSLAQMPGLWHAVVKDFSRRRLTFAKDRLPALSGIADAIPWPKEDYHAGLWRQTILYDLTWFNPLGNEKWKEIAGERTRKTFYSVEYHSSRILAMPSWSWTSITGMVKFSLNQISDLKIEWELRDIKCAPTTTNRFGPVQLGSFIRLNGYFTPVLIMESRQTPLDEDPNDVTQPISIEMCIVREDGECHGWNKAWFDTDPEHCEWPDLEEELFVLVAGTRTADDNPIALILKRSKGLVAEAVDSLTESDAANIQASVGGDPTRKHEREHYDLVPESLTGASQTNNVAIDASRALKQAKTGDRNAVDGSAEELIVANSAEANAIGQAAAAKGSAEPAEDEFEIQPQPGIGQRGPIDEEEETFVRIGMCQLYNWKDFEWREMTPRRTVKII